MVRRLVVAVLLVLVVSSCRWTPECRTFYGHTICRGTTVQPA